MRPIVVPIELPPAAHALVLAAALSAGHKSVASYIVSMLADDARAFGEALADKQDPTTAEIFTL